MTTNCINCGAPLTGNKCEYCGTNYENDLREILADMQIADLERKREEIKRKIQLNMCMQDVMNCLPCPVSAYPVTNIDKYFSKPKKKGIFKRCRKSRS